MEVPQKYENICCSLELLSLIPLTNKTQKKLIFGSYCLWLLRWRMHVKKPQNKQKITNLIFRIIAPDHWGDRCRWVDRKSMITGPDAPRCCCPPSHDEDDAPRCCCSTIPHSWCMLTFQLSEFQMVWWDLINLGQWRKWQQFWTKQTNRMLLENNC